MQRGFVPLVFILIVGVLSAGLVGGVYIYKQKFQKEKCFFTDQYGMPIFIPGCPADKSAAIKPIVSPPVDIKIDKKSDNKKSYQNSNIGIELGYIGDGYIEEHDDFSFDLRLPYRPKGQFLDPRITFIQGRNLYYSQYKKDYSSCDENNAHKNDCWKTLNINGKNVEYLGGYYLRYYYVPDLNLEISVDSTANYNMRNEVTRIIESIKFLK